MCAMWNQLSTVDFVASVALSKDDPDPALDARRRPNAACVHMIPKSVAPSARIEGKMSSKR
ncbi:Zinc finger protein 714 [Frankliniella fusca]|uniref:Zinc finger protein 714 n=1 Tax=Frankliniella fusca TaxID=407009 RepID=A0AAE1L7G7_9NEOP|nr:Zinc finger protein 714 [Frankliniella fusca]